MIKGAVIVENRDIDVPSIIERHKKFLPESWEVIHISDDSVKTRHDYNKLLTTRSFWEKIPFDKVLIFQWDSGLLRKGIEDFLYWDFIGAPWNWRESGGNGGLSLRTKDTMLKIIDHAAFDQAVSEGYNEDIYFCDNIEKIGGKLAPRSVCEVFNVKTVYKIGTLGYHAIDKFHSPEQIETIINQYK